MKLHHPLVSYGKRRTSKKDISPKAIRKIQPLKERVGKQKGFYLFAMGN